MESNREQLLKTITGRLGNAQSVVLEKKNL